MYQLAVLASGNGTNAEALFNHFKNHARVRVAALLSNNPDAFALQRARNHGIETFVFDKKQFRESDDVVMWLRERGITHLVLAGFLWLVPPRLIRAYPHRIVNIHPALLPKFGGKGMYGKYVHEAVKKSGDDTTGITIHLVDEQYDEGRILFQATCPVQATDTAEEMAGRIHQLEHAHYPSVVERWVLGEL
ncbi:MAG: phosphoribosylglycinamide formyltransferase [Cyclobacteriaceae bacterium]|jgi:phosphoribosylglycinamide formyltransferase-1|nr:phosphoribosylglycinamide formyltransferase [Cyclobacteriaceae bacterium]